MIEANAITTTLRRRIVMKKTQNAQQYKTAELSQRRPRDAPNIWVPWKVSIVLTTHPVTRMCVQNLKFVALPVP